MTWDSGSKKGEKLGGEHTLLFLRRGKMVETCCSIINTLKTHWHGGWKVPHPTPNVTMLLLATWHCNWFYRIWVVFYTNTCSRGRATLKINKIRITRPSKNRLSKLAKLYCVGINVNNIHLTSRRPPRVSFIQLSCKLSKRMDNIKEITLLSQMRSYWHRGEDSIRRATARGIHIPHRV